MTVATVLSDITPVLADGELIMKLHYHGEDGAYDGWDAWLWPDGGEGGGYAFADEGGEMVSGTVHIYVESGVEGYTKEYGEDAVIGTKLKGTVYNGDKTISAQMTGNIEGDAGSAFSVSGKSGDIAVVSVQEGADYVYIITLAEELENSKSYKITFDGTEQITRMSFSMAKDGPWRPR